MTVTGRQVALALVPACALAACGSSDRPTGSAGTAAGAAVVAAVEAAAQVRAPWRCAALAPASGPAELGAWRREGTTLRAATPRVRLVVAAVAQAHGTALPDPLRAALVAAGPDVVLAVGGMGEDQAGLERALAALAVDGALVVAVPGDAEPWPALAAAVDRLAADGVAIVDGARVRALDSGGAVVATLPGLAYPGLLGAGVDGCLHDDDDVGATLTALTGLAGERPRLLVTARAPQGAGDDVHDRVDGVHAGDPALAAALVDAGLTLTIHGLPTVMTEGHAGRGAGAVVAAGSLDPGPSWDDLGRAAVPAVTVAVVDDDGVRWRALTARAW